MEYRKTLSNTCWAVKALAILFVIIAHTNFSTIQNPILGMVFGRLGAMAVPIFLILAGYYYDTNKIRSLGHLIKKKAVGLCLPWFFCGVLVYSYTALRTNTGLQFGAAIRFLLGNGSYLYYLTVLLILQIVFYFLRKGPRAHLLWTCMGISAISLLITASGITAPLFKKLCLTNYLNILNWCGFFALGFAVQQWDAQKLIKGIQQLWIPAAILWGLLFAVGYFIESHFGYFSWLGYPMELCSSILLLRLGLMLSDCSKLCALGKYSFSIYLLHIQVIPVVAKFIGNTTVGLLVSPMATYAATWAALWCIHKISHKLKFSNITKLLIGIR